MFEEQVGTLKVPWVPKAVKGQDMGNGKTKDQDLGHKVNP